MRRIAVGEGLAEAKGDGDGAAQACVLLLPPPISSCSWTAGATCAGGENGTEAEAAEEAPAGSAKAPAETVRRWTAGNGASNAASGVEGERGRDDDRGGGDGDGVQGSR